MKKGITLFMLGLFVGILAGKTEAAVRWNLEFKPVKMDRVSIRTGIQWKAYWYLVYQVTNKTDETVPLYLSIKATSDAANRTYFEGYYKRVERAIERKEGRDLLNIQEMRGEIGPGETKEAMAIFGSVVESTDVLKVRVLGLWDRISHEGKKVFIEDRALILTYYRPGDEYFPQYDRIRLKKTAWVVLHREAME